MPMLAVREEFAFGEEDVPFSGGVGSAREIMRAAYRTGLQPATDLSEDHGSGLSLN
tara:strand:+ start:71 stop:238 length:168 start_codon:yes stop_codon:yes gene_type:complete